MSKIIIALIALITAYCLFILFRLFFSGHYPPLHTVNIKGHDYQLETASNPIAQAKGLSNRTSLCGNCGMIFIFPTESTLTFWMKDTLIPLDLIWLNSDGLVVKIITAQPQLNTPTYKLATYRNDQPAKYVIELNQGEAARIGLIIGETVNLDL